ncbi:hypothetical protein ACVDG8_037490 (plasmid) [Mesorhizobium sp. ORM8.1]
MVVDELDIENFDGLSAAMIDYVERMAAVLIISNGDAMRRKQLRLRGTGALAIGIDRLPGEIDFDVMVFGTGGTNGLEPAAGPSVVSELAGDDPVRIADPDQVFGFLQAAKIVDAAL